jgi:hypothetical protein
MPKKWLLLKMFMAFCYIRSLWMQDIASYPTPKPDTCILSVVHSRLLKIFASTINMCGLGSAVGITTRYRLGGPGIESRWGGARFSAPVQTGPRAHPAYCTMSTRSFLEVKSGRDMTLNPHPLLVPWSWKGRAIPLLPLWAVRPVQSLSACTGVNFTLTYFYH